MHHLVPSTRDGETNEFNLFPYRIKSHRAYHEIFLNMTIWEVWNALESIYKQIFSIDQETIKRHWLFVCRLDKSHELQVQIEKVYQTEYLQEKWILAFGGSDLNRAKNFLVYMMLFMVFGSCMADTEELFENGNLIDFLEQYPQTPDRLKAFDICFGEFASNHAIKAKMSKITRQLP